MKNIFVNATKLSNIIYFKWGKVGHKAYTCLLNKFDDRNIKRIWISKGTIVTNSKGPKLAWIPKVKIWSHVCRCVLHPKQQKENGILIVDAQDTW